MLWKIKWWFTGLVADFIHEVMEDNNYPIATGVFMAVMFALFTLLLVEAALSTTRILATAILSLIVPLCAFVTIIASFSVLVYVRWRFGEPITDRVHREVL